MTSKLKSPDTRSPKVLLENARNGDTQSLEALLIHVQPQLYRFSLKMCRNEADAEDVLQDSMLTLARNFRDFQGASSLSTWLYTITRSFCIKKRRKSKFAPSYEEPLHELSNRDQSGMYSPNKSPHENAENSELWEQIQSAISKLDPAYREVLVLRDIEGLSAKEVSEIVGLSVPAVKSRLHRARSVLREYLTQANYQPKDDCPDIRRFFSEHLEGDLSPDICATMESHIQSCPACASECQGLKQAIHLCSNAVCSVPAEVQSKIQHTLRSIIGKPSP